MNIIAFFNFCAQNSLYTSSLDFGFAQYLEKEQDFRIRGTPLYMAPEMLLQHHYDAKVELMCYVALQKSFAFLLDELGFFLLAESDCCSSCTRSNTDFLCNLTFK